MERMTHYRDRAVGLGWRVARGALRRIRKLRHRGPEISVIVPFYNVEDYLAECLDSLLAQGFSDFEVLLVDDGSPDGSRAIAVEYAARDGRLRVITRANGGLGAARNTGVREARGRYLTFVDSDDLLPPGALSALVASAHETGSQIVCGSVERFDSRKTWSPGWVGDVHLVKRQRVTIEDFLPLLRNLYTWNKLYRRDFFVDQGLWFREGVAYEDQPIITQLFARARSIDVIPDVVYRYRARDDKSSISQQTSTVRDLRDRVAAWRISREVLGRELSRLGYETWLLTLFSAHFRWYLTNPGTADDAYWDLLQEAVADLSAEAPQWVWDSTPPSHRIIVRLTQLGRRNDLQEFVRRDGMKPDRWPAHVREDGILLDLPFLGDPDIDEFLFVLRPDQVRIWQSIENARWTDGACGPGLRIAGWAFLDKVDLAVHESHVTVVLRHEKTGEVRTFPATERPAACFNPPRDDPWCDYRQGRFGAEVSIAGLMGSRGDDVWEVWLRVEAAGLVTEEPLIHRVPDGAADRIPAAWLGGGDRVVPEWPHGRPLRLHVDRRAVLARDLRLEGRTLSGLLEVQDDGGVVRLEAASGSRLAVGTWVSPQSSTRRFEVTLPALGRPAAGRPRTWVLSAVVAGGQRCNLVTGAGPCASPAVGDLVVTTGHNGEVVVHEWALGAVADRVEVSTDGVVTVEGRLMGGDAGLLLATMDGQDRVDGEPTVSEGGQFTAVLEMRRRRHRFERLALGTGDHDLTVVLTRAGLAEQDRELPLVVGPALDVLLPLPVDVDEIEGRVVRGAGDAVRITLRRPLGTGRGQYRQRRLRQGPARPALTRGVLLRSSHGAAILDALRRRGSDLPAYWAVPDRSAPVPGDAIPVVVGRPEFYDLAFAATYLVTDAAMPAWQTKTPGQVWVRMANHPRRGPTRFPSAPVGVSQRAAGWDYVVSPARYATPLVVREAGPCREVLEIGSPRNDVLHPDRAPALRSTVRESLGIRADQTAVLYAPQLRDRSTSAGAQAGSADLLDLDRLARALGDSHVLLVHGHTFKARADRRVAGFRGCLELTDYPELSDLLVAADAAVLDYSPVRFDVGVAGIPMIFFVPDRQQHQDSHGWRLHSEPTAPGPWLDTTDQVVDALLDLDSVRSRHALDYERFRASFLELEDGAAGERLVESVFATRGDA